MKIHYSVYEEVIKDKQITLEEEPPTLSACANSPGNDSGIEDQSPTYDTQYEEGDACNEFQPDDSSELVENVKTPDDTLGRNEEEMCANENSNISCSSAENEKQIHQENSSDKESTENPAILHTSGDDDSDKTCNKSDVKGETEEELPEEEGSDTSVAADCDSPASVDDGSSAKSCPDSFRNIETQNDSIVEQKVDSPVQETEEAELDEDNKMSSENSKADDEKISQEKDIKVIVQDDSPGTDMISECPLVIDTTRDENDHAQKDLEMPPKEEASEETENADHVEEPEPGPTFNDSVAQTSPYFEDDTYDSEDNWNEGAIDLSKPKMIVIEPLSGNDASSANDQKPREDIQNCDSIDSVNNEPEIEEEVQEYTYVVDGLHEIEGTPEYEQAQAAINADIFEHSYSMLPSLQPLPVSKANETKPILNTPKYLITSNTPKHIATNPNTSTTSYTLKSQRSFKAMPATEILSTKRRKRHETNWNALRCSGNEGKKKARKCTSVCNGHLVTQRSDKLVVKLCKGRNSEHYTATMS